MGGKATRQELSRHKARARLLAALFDRGWQRDRQVGSFVIGRLRRRPVGFVAASAGLLAWFLIGRASSGTKR
jgi:hypothetical protein